MTMATLATAVTAIRRHMYEATSHQVSMNRHRLAAGQQLLALRKRIEAGECGDVGWWQWYAANVDRSRKDALQGEPRGAARSCRPRSLRRP